MATVTAAVKTPKIIIAELGEIFPTDIGSGGRRASPRDRRATARELLWSWWLDGGVHHKNDFL